MQSICKETIEGIHHPQPVYCCRGAEASRGGIPNLSPTLQSFDIRKTWSIWDTVVVVDDGKYTGVVFKSFFTKDFESPHGLGCNRIARRAETGYRCSRDIFYNSPRTPQVIAKIRLVAVVNHLMRVSVASDAVACLTDRLNQPWKPLCYPTQDKKRCSNMLTREHFQQSERILLNSAWVTIPVGTPNYISESLDVKIVLNVNRHRV